MEMCNALYKCNWKEYTRWSFTFTHNSLQPLSTLCPLKHFFYFLVECTTIFVLFPLLIRCLSPNLSNVLKYKPQKETLQLRIAVIRSTVRVIKTNIFHMIVWFLTYSSCYLMLDASSVVNSRASDLHCIQNFKILYRRLVFNKLGTGRL